jgi:hypothetical protein
MSEVEMREEKMNSGGSFSLKDYYCKSATPKPSHNAACRFTSSRGCSKKSIHVDLPFAVCVLPAGKW